MNRNNINKLVELYFKYNPNMNKGIGFRIKAYDVIKDYLIKNKKSYEEIKLCIEKNPMCQKPIWVMFREYFFENKSKSKYKESINDSTNPDDWF